jgi:hypothetical protein
LNNLLPKQFFIPLVIANAYYTKSWHKIALVGGLPKADKRCRTQRYFMPLDWFNAARRYK